MIHIHHHFDAAIMRQLHRIDENCAQILERLDKMALDFTKLETEVTENNDVIQSVITLLTQIAQDIRDAAGNQAKITDLATRLDTQSNALAEAVAANTPAEPAPEPAPSE